MNQDTSSIRPDSHAGTWYESDPHALRSKIRELLASCPSYQPNRNIRAIIAPHAGVAYSGRTAAHAYKHLSPHHIKTVFVLGPNHHAHSQTLSVSPYTYYSSPLGSIPLNTSIMAYLATLPGFSIMSKRVDVEEHCIELHLPFIQTLLTDVTLVPLLVGNISSQTLGDVSQALGRYYSDETCLFIVSSDFCHWGERFGYTPFPYVEGVALHEYIEEMDKRGMDVLKKKSLQAWKSYLMETGNTVCGRNALSVLIKLMQSKEEERICFIHYEQSSRAEDTGSSVSYIAAYAGC